VSLVSREWRFGPPAYATVYGKWAFYRLGPIQEPFSVLMSIGNFWAHWQGFKEVRRRVSGDNKMKKWLIALAVIQMNTWIWSTVFHTRGTFLPPYRCSSLIARCIIDRTVRLLLCYRHDRLVTPVHHRENVATSNTQQDVSTPPPRLGWGNLHRLLSL